MPRSVFRIFKTCVTKSHLKKYFAEINNELFLFIYELYLFILFYFIYLINPKNIYFIPLKNLICIRFV